MNKKFLISAFVVVVMIILLIAIWQLLDINSSKKFNSNLKIVLSAPMRNTFIGQGIVNSIKLALKESNYQVGPYNLNLIVEDVGDENGVSQGSLEKEIAMRAVADLNVIAYMGAESGMAKVSLPITNQAGLLQISPANTWPGLTQPGFLPGEPGIFYPTGVRNYFRVVPTDAIQGPIGAVWAKNLNIKSIYIFDDGEAYGSGIADLFEKKAIDLNLKVIGREKLDKSENGIKKAIEKLKTSNPDLVYYGGTTPNGAPQLVKEMRANKISAKFMGADAIMEQSFIDQAAEAAEGTLITSVGIPGDKLIGKGKDFYDKYRLEYGRDPEPYSSFAYEATKIIILAIERAQSSDRATIIREMANIKNYDGIFGNWSFDQNGDTTLSTISGNMVKDKVFIFDRLLSD